MKELSGLIMIAGLGAGYWLFQTITKNADNVTHEILACAMATMVVVAAYVLGRAIENIVGSWSDEFQEWKAKRAAQKEEE